MALFNPLSYVVELEAAGVSRQQAQVHAQTLQQVYHEEHRQYATKADLLQVSRISVFKKIKNGQLKAKKIGRNYAFPKSEITEIFLLRCS